MLHLALTLVLAQPAAPTTARAAIGAELAAAVDRADALSDAEQALRDLRAAAAEAVRGLGDQRVAELIEGEVLDARWQAVVDPRAAIDELVADLEALASDLEFEPLMEAEMPPGFPEPTPLHEVRLTEYPGYRLAYADMEGPRDGSAFFKLFRHIQSNQISMTAPVEVTFDGGRMEQTRMAFLYEGPTQGTTGNAGEVEVVDIAPMTVVSIGCRGRDSMGRIEDMAALLEGWVASQPEWEPAGELRTMGFNSPMVPNSRRFFEVQLPVRKVEQAAKPDTRQI
ncbi:MAG: heme-binding protein [Planctomycetota bacterium]